MLEYKSPTFLEMPPVETILIESDDPEGPFGAKEAGQGPLLPVIPAVANAVYDAVGVRIDEIPISPDKVLAALEQRAKGGPARVGPRGIPAFPFRAPLVVEPPAGWDQAWRPDTLVAGGAQGPGWHLHTGTDVDDGRGGCHDRESTSATDPDAEGGEDR
jgi:hypothetical protein